MSAWWQKKVLRYGLRYALSRTGLLEEQALDVDNLDITLGKQNVIELKDIGLNIKRIAQLAQLPPCLRLETARVLVLRLTVPADFYQSSIVVEVDGVEIVARLQEVKAPEQSQDNPRSRSPATSRTPPHRKMSRRIASPPSKYPGNASDSEDELHIPTTKEVAKSFMKEEPPEEREDLEALAAGNNTVDESFVSESSDGDVGTGAGVGAPGFITNFLQGIVDRFKVHVNNIKVTMEAEIGGETGQAIPLALRLEVGAVDLDRLRAHEEEGEATPRRKLEVHDCSVALLSDDHSIPKMHGVRSNMSPPTERSPEKSLRTSQGEEHLKARLARQSSLTNAAVMQRSAESNRNLPNRATTPQPRPLQQPHVESFMDAEDTNSSVDAEIEDADDAGNRSSILDIKPGDDNISWGSRRSQASAPSDDLWKSMVSDDDLPESLIIQPGKDSARRVFHSRDSSPSATRNTGGVTSAKNYQQSPGSWPRMDESPQRRRSSPSPPGRGNAMSAHLHSYGALDEMLASSTSSLTDNKRSAIEQASPVSELDTQPEPEEDVADNMMESKMFSHEEAQSMYMSAMTGSPRMDMPGGWEPDVLSEKSSSPDRSRARVSRSPPRLDGSMISAASSVDTNVPSGHATPRAQSPSPSNSPQAGSQSREVRELVFIDNVVLLIPADGMSASQAQPPSDARPEKVQRPVTASRLGHELPGTFSAYSEASSSRHRSAAHPAPGSSFLQPAPPRIADTTSAGCDVSVGLATVQLDLATCQLLHRVSSTATASLAAESGKRPQQAADRDSIPTPAVSVQIESFRISICERISPGLSLREANKPHLIGLACERLKFSSSRSTELSIGSLQTSLNEQPLLRFLPGEEPVAGSQSMLNDSAAVNVSIFKVQTAPGARPVTEISLRTGKLVLNLDLDFVDETFACFGGISGMLELGGSFLLGEDKASASASKPPKGVRFSNEAQEVPQGPVLKLNGEIGGVNATLEGPGSSLRLRTSPLRLVHREQGTSATISRIQLDGPDLPGDDQNAPVSVNLTSLRIEYLLTPHDKDLERLITLLTPSKDKYDNDDDILIDTLLRQRRKGALLRVAFDGAKARVDNWDCISRFTSLGDDLAKLSAVAKYLPEDERPGILTLVRIKSAQARLPVNERFGYLDVHAQDIHVAHVGLPALLAFSVRDILAAQPKGSELIHSLVPVSASDNLPVVMARIVGDEEEPTVKLKLFNLCIEYSVPAILELTNMDREMEPEEMVNAMAQSVANIALADHAPESHSAKDSKSPSKRTVLDLLVHNSAIGLTPQNLPSKVLLVLSDVHASTKIPPEATVEARLELRKASLLIRDQLNGLAEPSMPASLSKADRDFAVKCLVGQGFVSVGSVMSASVGISASESAALGAKMVELDVKNELLLVETCADSLQTLIATFGALAPPTPPNRQPKYLTEPLAIEDLLKSLSGEEPAQSKPQKIIFDADNDAASVSSNVSLTGSMLDNADQMMGESLMTGSLYGPVSGILDVEAGPDKESTVDGDYLDTAESLLEDDPFEMTMAPEELMGDPALMRDLNRQAKSAVKDKCSKVEVDDIDDLSDLGYDALGSGQQTLGDPNRFNAPYSKVRLRPRDAAHGKDVPFRLRLHDFNVIWHLYDGYDWQRTRDGIVEAVEEVEQKAEARKARRQQPRDDPDDDGSVIGDFLFNSIYIGVPNTRDAQDLRRQINRGIDNEVSETASIPASGMSRPSTYSASGQPRNRQRRRLKLGRGKNHKVAFELKGVSADFILFPPGSGETVSSVDLRLTSFEIFDNLPSSTWRKFLTHMAGEPRNREIAKPMFHIQMENVKTIESHAATEMRLHVSVLPLRLHVDQDTLDFITRFFEFKDGSQSAPTPDSEKPFIQRIEVESVDLCLDYKPKTIDYAGLRSGKTSEFMNIVMLESANIKLRHAIAYGILGFEELHPRLNDLWMADVKKNQLPTVLGGIAAVSGLVNLGAGIKDVVAVPIAEYKRHGRIMRSVQAGGMVFGKTTTAELARLGAKVAMGTQTLLSTAERMLSTSDTASSSRPASGHRASGDQWHDVGSASDDDEPEQKAVSAYANQPLGVLSGLKSARRFLEHDLLTAKDALIAVQGEWMDSRNPGEVAGAVVRHAPTVILRPVIGASRAVGTALLGVGNQIDRGNLRKVDDVSCC